MRGRAWRMLSRRLSHLLVQSSDEGGNGDAPEKTEIKKICNAGPPTVYDCIVHRDHTPVEVTGGRRFSREEDTVVTLNVIDSEEMQWHEGEARVRAGQKYKWG